LDFGLIIRQRRKQLGLTKTELAGQVGVTRQWISAVESGRVRVELGLVLRTITVLDLALAVVDEHSLLKQSERGTTIDINAIVDDAKKKRS